MVYGVSKWLSQRLDCFRAVFLRCGGILEDALPQGGDESFAANQVHSTGLVLSTCLAGRAASPRFQGADGVRSEAAKRRLTDGTSRLEGSSCVGWAGTSATMSLPLSR